MPTGETIVIQKQNKKLLHPTSGFTRRVDSEIGAKVFIQISTGFTRRVD
jgi:hypothetical protein